MTKPNREWERLTWLVGLHVATGYLEGEIPKSLLLVGDPGVGKSATLDRFASVPTVRTLADITSDPLRKKVIPEAVRDGVRHLLFPEMIKIFQRNQNTTANTVGVLTLGMSGELHEAFVGADDPVPVPPGWSIGLIGAMTTKIFNDWHQTIMNNGLLSRMIPCHVRFSEATRREIEQAIISGDKSMVSRVRWDIPLGQHVVTFGRHMQDTALDMVDEIRPVKKGNTGNTRNRLVGSVRAYLKASALLDGRREVDNIDVHKVMSIIELLKE